MRRTRRTASRTIGVLAALALGAAACSGGSDDGEPAPTTVPAGTTTSAASSTTSTIAPASTTSSTTNVPTTSIAPTTTFGPTTTIAAPTTTTPRTDDVKVYLMRGDRLGSVRREVSAPAVLRGALTALVRGPTDAERAAGLASAIPAGTQLRDVRLAGGLATVDLSGEFGTGGGSLSMMARVAEVVFTATQFPTVDRVLFLMDGVVLTVLGGEGLLLDGPQTRAMIDPSISGNVIIDAPLPGATVRSPFVVRGEGQVYEAQFPIEIWAGGRLILTHGPVWAGAWGTWAGFETTIAVDAPAGPIELVAYDAGGCGTDPECPPIIKTVVPLVLVR